jgi:hypothetical protein
MLLSLSSELPPFSRRVAFHVANRGDQHVQDARVMLRLRDPAKVTIHSIRILPDQFGRPAQPQYREFLRTRRPYIRKIDKRLDFAPFYRIAITP